MGDFKVCSAKLPAVAALLAILFGFNGPALAGHPFVTEDPGTQGKGNVEAEFSYEYVKNGDGTKTTSLGNGFTLGVAPKIDLAVGYGYDFVKAPDGARDRGMGDVEAQMKTFFNEGKGWTPTFGLKGGVSLPVKEGGRTTILATGIAEWAFEPFTVFANVGADLGTRLAGNDERTDVYRAGVAGVFAVREGLALLSELVWEKQTSPSEDATAEWMAGVQWGLNDAMTLDAAVRFGLTDDSPDYTVLLGFTWVFQGEKTAAAPAGGK
jgi:opacity protein-like surface antigen